MTNPKYTYHTLTVAALAVVTILTPSFAQAEKDPVIPENSRIASAPDAMQRLLLSPLDRGEVKSQGGLHLITPSVAAYPGLAPKAGMEALKFSAVSVDPEGKGDFYISDRVPGEVEELGMWVYIESDSNVREVGFQITDGEGESLMALARVDWEGWKWVEFNLRDDSFIQAYEQEGKNHKVEFPVNNVRIAWFTRQEGPTHLGVDALTALSKMENPGAAYKIDLISPPWGEAGEILTSQASIHNYSDKTMEVNFSSRLQRNPIYQTMEIPDPVHGAEHVQGQPSWFVFKGERVAENTLTDGDETSHSNPKMQREALTEFMQYIDMGQARNITRIGWKAGDGNWVNKLDVLSSADGKNFTPVAGLQNINLHGRYGNEIHDLENPGHAERYLQLRYHNDGENLLAFFRTLSYFNVYDGAENDTIALPSFGEVLVSEELTVQVPPRRFRLLPFKASPPLGTDAYLFGILAEVDGVKDISLADYFVMPEEDIQLSPDSRFGINVGAIDHVDILARAGFGWVRFENMKWRFYNPEENDFRFDGTVAPWNVPFDKWLSAYKEKGMTILPYIFQTPTWASSAPEGTKRNIGGYPPVHKENYAKAVFQAVARFGSRKVPEDQLLSPDKMSGLGLIQTYELWNEQNLNNPGWGFWVGSLEEYYPMFRMAAEAAKKADPDARVTNGGWAGLSLEHVDTMRTYKYPDGKTPLDLTDVINVHYYTGKSDPEYSTLDPNAFREGEKPEDIQTHEDNLVDLADWRDEFKPEAPIWVTETGYDVGGPMGLDERHQAAKLTRGNMLAFANGIEKMFIYRESGSDRSKHMGSGLLTNHGSVRPSLFSMATQTRQFKGITQDRAPRLKTNDPDVWMYYWNRPGGNLLTVWAPKESSTLGIDLGRCLVTTAFGAEKEMEVTKDFPLSMFPVYITKIGNLKAIEELQRTAAEEMQAQQKRKAFDKQANAHLFDFGSTEFIGTKIVGNLRHYTPVLAETGYTPEQGYGYEILKGGRNGVSGYMRSSLEKDSVDSRQDSVFKVDLEPGTYRLQYKGRNFAEGALLKITSPSLGELTTPIKAGREGAPTEPQFLKIPSKETISIQVPLGGTQWITVIEWPEE